MTLFKADYLFLLDEAIKQMIVDVQEVKNFKLGDEQGDKVMDILDGMIKYKVGDAWSAKATDGYVTMFAYYHYYHNPRPDKSKILEETFKDKKAIGIESACLSYAEIPLYFNQILGVTGTLDTLSDQQLKIMKEVYNFISMTYAPSVYDIPPHLKKEEDKIDGLKEEILIMNENTEKYNAGKTSDENIDVINEMAVDIFKTKDEWFEYIA
jgi:hypothetical protein